MRVVDAPSAAHRRLPGLVQPVRETEPRREVVVIPLAQRTAHAHLIGGLDRNRRRGEERADVFPAGVARYYDLARGQVERVDIVVQRVRRAVVFVAQPVHQGEARRDSKIVLRVARPVAEADVLRLVWFHARHRERQSQQEVGVGVARERAREGVASQNRVAGSVGLKPVVEPGDLFHAELHGVMTGDQTQVVGHLRVPVVHGVE